MSTVRSPRQRPAPELAARSTPVIGDRYRVPHVRGTWLGHWRWWPVRGALHSDADHFAFTLPHYHLDERFVPWPLMAREDPMGKARGAEAMDPRDAWEIVLRWPLHAADGQVPADPARAERFRLVGPRLRTAICMREAGASGHRLAAVPLWTRFARLFAGRPCPRDTTGEPRCPHRGFPLGAEPVHDGIVTCPLHGLRVDTRTWTVARLPEPPRAPAVVHVDLAARAPDPGEGGPR